MRAQQEAILNRIAAVKAGGTIHIGVGFMPLGELMESAEHVLSEIGFAHDLNRGTVQQWISIDLLTEHADDPKLRNRLYSMVDLMLLVSVAVVSRLGLGLGIAKAVSAGFKDTLSHNLDSLDPSVHTLDHQARRLLVVTPSAPDEVEGWNIKSNFDQAGLLLHMLESPRGISITVDPRTIYILSIDRGTEVWKAKALQWADKIQAHLQRHGETKPSRAPKKRKGAGK